MTLHATKFYRIPIEYLELSEAVQNRLRSKEITTIGKLLDLLTYGPYDALKSEDFTDEILDEILNKFIVYEYHSS